MMIILLSGLPPPFQRKEKKEKQFYAYPTQIHSILTTLHCGTIQLLEIFRPGFGSRMVGFPSIHFGGRWWEIQPTPSGISIHWMDFHLVVGIPSILDRFPTTWMEIQPLGLVGPDVAVIGQLLHQCTLRPGNRNCLANFTTLSLHILVQN